MGHIVSKDLFRKLGRKLDNLSVRVPWNDTLFQILKMLYTPEEAKLILKMPYGLATFAELVRITGYDEKQLRAMLDVLCPKGLIIDLYLHDQYYYTISPMVIGIFEFTLMRTKGDLAMKEWAEHFHAYLLGSSDIFDANYGKGERFSIMRTLPHEGTFVPYTEVLDYEKAAALIEQGTQFAIGTCSCRHEKHHLDLKPCDVPLDTCLSFNSAADYLIRRSMARPAEKAEIRDTIMRSRELGLVLNADNVQRNIDFICQCCKCCCNALAGINLHGHPHAVVSSSFIAHITDTGCLGCGLCEKVCPVNAVTPLPQITSARHRTYAVNETLCLGCGVCAVKCPARAALLKPRPQRIFHPESTFERLILQCLEHGTLQNNLFPEPEKFSHQLLRGLIGGFLRLPVVKRQLLSEQLRSRFLNALKAGARRKGLKALTDK